MAQANTDEGRFELLQKCVENHSPELLEVLERMGKVPLTENERLLLQLAVGAELCRNGLDISGGHNEYGLACEDVIDWLAHQ